MVRIEWMDNLRGLWVVSVEGRSRWKGWPKFVPIVWVYWKMENRRVVTKIHEGKRTGNHRGRWGGGVRERNGWIKWMGAWKNKKQKKQRGLDVRQARKMVQQEWMSGVCEGECLWLSSGDKPLNLTKYHSCSLAKLSKSIWSGGFSEDEPTT